MYKRRFRVQIKMLLSKKSRKTAIISVRFESVFKFHHDNRGNRGICGAVKQRICGSN